MPATGENKRRIGREWARRNSERNKSYKLEIQPSGLTRNQEYVRNRPEITLRNNAKRRARIRGRPFNLSIDDVAELISEADGRCSVSGCGTLMEIGNRKLGNSSPTLDEVRVGEGYVLGNTAVICYVCNRRKSDMTSDQLRRLADWADSFDKPQG